MEVEVRRVPVFFYGTFMSPAVLAQYGIIVGDVLPAKVAGFELYIRPRVNLVPSEGANAYGTVVSVTHEDLEKIYSDLEKRFGLKYLPEAVLAETTDGKHTARPALCYITPHMTPGPPDPEYVRELAACVRALNFPESYALHIESFG